MDRCNELCTKEVLGHCALCAALAERDRFERFWFKGGLFIDGLRALNQWWRPTNHGEAPLVPLKGIESASGAWQKYPYNRTYGIIRAKMAKASPARILV